MARGAAHPEHSVCKPRRLTITHLSTAIPWKTVLGLAWFADALCVPGLWFAGCYFAYGRDVTEFVSAEITSFSVATSLLDLVSSRCFVATAILVSMACGRKSSSTRFRLCVCLLWIASSFLAFKTLYIQNSAPWYLTAPASDTKHALLSTTFHTVVVVSLLVSVVELAAVYTLHHSSCATVVSDPLLPLLSDDGEPPKDRPACSELLSLARAEYGLVAMSAALSLLASGAFMASVHLGGFIICDPPSPAQTSPPQPPSNASAPVSYSPTSPGALPCTDGVRYFVYSLAAIAATVLLHVLSQAIIDFAGQCFATRLRKHGLQLVSVYADGGAPSAHPGDRSSAVLDTSYAMSELSGLMSESFLSRTMSLHAAVAGPCALVLHLSSAVVATLFYCCYASMPLAIALLSLVLPVVIMLVPFMWYAREPERTDRSARACVCVCVCLFACACVRARGVASAASAYVHGRPRAAAVAQVVACLAAHTQRESARRDTPDDVRTPAYPSAPQRTPAYAQHPPEYDALSAAAVRCLLSDLHSVKKLRDETQSFEESTVQAQVAPAPWDNPQRATPIMQPAARNMHRAANHSAYAIQHPARNCPSLEHVQMLRPQRSVYAPPASEPGEYPTHPCRTT